MLFYLLPSRRRREACSSTSSLMIIGIPSFLHLLSLYPTTNQTPRTCSIHPKTIQPLFPFTSKECRHLPSSTLPSLQTLKLPEFRSRSYNKETEHARHYNNQKKGIAAVTTWQMANIPARSSILLNNYVDLNFLVSFGKVKTSDRDQKGGSK